MSAAWVIETLVASTLLMLAVLLVRAPVRRAFGAQVGYMLWLLPVARLLLPPLPESWRHIAVAPIARAGETITVLVVSPAPGGTVDPLPIGTILGAAWALGAALFLAWHLVRYRAFCRRVRHQALASRCVDGVTMLVSAGAPGPVAFGLRRRVVAFPADFLDRYDADEQALALAHEIGHHRRGDLIANWAALAVLAIHWWNPVAWRAYRAFRSDQELANDAGVIAATDAGLRHAYGRAIVKAAHGGTVSAACHLHTIDDLKGRLKMLGTSPIARRRQLVGGLAIGAATLGALALTASGSQAAALAEHVTNAVGIPLPQAPETSPAPESAAIRAMPTVARMPSMRTAPANYSQTALAPAATPPSSADSPTPETAAPSGPVTVIADRIDAPANATGPIRITVRDGAPKTFTVRVPEIRNAHCPGDHVQPPVVNTTTATGQRIIICTNRIETMAKDAQQTAMNSAEIERTARANARTSLVAARASIEADRNLTDTQKHEALDGIAQAEKELASDK